jgi:hypothetical protein
MSEDNTESLNGGSTNPTPFEEYIKAQFEMIQVRLTKIEAKIETEAAGIRTEMVERFVQLRRQVRELDQKVDIFIREQIYIKDDIRELRESRIPKN